jgi:superfamily II DNA helicase RecQ
MPSTCGPNPSSPLPTTWSDQNIRTLIEAKLKRRPCLFQNELARAVYSKKDVIGIAATGSGKSLTMYMPFLMARADGWADNMVFIVGPLNNLAQQTEAEIQKHGLRALALNGDNATNENFKVCFTLASAFLLTH